MIGKWRKHYNVSHSGCDLNRFMSYSSAFENGCYQTKPELFSVHVSFVRHTTNPLMFNAVSVKLTLVAH